MNPEEMSWNEHQEWEKDWHSGCQNSYWEESKQICYARKMGIQFIGNNKTPYNIDLQGKSVIDIGGGAYSLLLKTSNFTRATVVDPCKYPNWIYARYKESNINMLDIKGEDFKLNKKENPYDECWVYNLLQHVENPSLVVKNALASCKILRIFEWLNTGIAVGHPNNLTEEDLNSWTKGFGKTEMLNEGGCVGMCYYGIFKGDHYSS